MRGKSGSGMMKSMALLGAPLLWATMCFAGDALRVAPSVRETQIMLYVTRPLDGRGAARSYGLRIDEASAPPIVAGIPALGPLRRRELVNLMFAPHARTQIEIGRRLNWDLRGHQLSLDKDRRSAAFHFEMAAARRTVRSTPP